jgi:RHS repeat-associated protein
MTQTKHVDRQRLIWQQTLLLAVDLKNSMLAELDASNPNRIAYSPYGHQSSELGVITRLGFNGEPREAKPGWYLLGKGYRAYNPRLMRFQSPDSLSPFGEGGINSYAFCSGEPINSCDPTGHVRVKVLPVRSLKQKPRNITIVKVRVIEKNSQAKTLKPKQSTTQPRAEPKTPPPVSVPIAKSSSGPSTPKNAGIGAAAPKIAPSQSESIPAQSLASKPGGMPELTRADNGIQQSPASEKRKMQTLPISANEGEIKQIRWLNPVVSIVRTS